MIWDLSVSLIPQMSAANSGVGVRDRNALHASLCMPSQNKHSFPSRSVAFSPPFLQSAEVIKSNWIFLLVPLLLLLPLSVAGRYILPAGCFLHEV